MTGRVEAVAVAVVRTDPWTRVKSGRSGIDKRPVGGPVLLTASGVGGDTICDVKHHGGPDQAVYAYSTDDLAWWSAELGRPVATVGQNLTLSGVDCSGAVIGERWQVGGANLSCAGRASRAGSSRASSTCPTSSSASSPPVAPVATWPSSRRARCARATRPRWCAGPATG